LKEEGKAVLVINPDMWDHTTLLDAPILRLRKEIPWMVTIASPFMRSVVVPSSSAPSA
jgi:hypothetical protein